MNALLEATFYIKENLFLGMEVQQSPRQTRRNTAVKADYTKSQRDVAQVDG
jgi:hypothetical protein